MKKKIPNSILKSVGVVILLLITLSSVTYGKTEPQLLQKTAMSGDTFGSSISGLVNDHIRLGTAYYSKEKSFLNVQTVDGVVNEQLGNTEFTIKAGVDLNYDKTLSMLNGNVDLDVNFPIVRVKAGGSIANEIAANDYSGSYIFQISTTPKKRVLLPRDMNQGFTLTPVGDEIATDHANHLYELAGDEFVTSIEYGAQLLVSMKIDYLNKVDKSAIGGYLGVDIVAGLVSVDGRLDFVNNDIKKSIKITVRAIQKGGDPKRLLTIIPNNIASCTLENAGPCFQLFQEAIDYAKNDFKTQFSSLRNYNVVRYYTTRYDASSLELKRLVPEYQVVKFETKIKMLELEEDYKKALADEKRARNLLNNFYSWMPENQRVEVEAIKHAAYTNAWIYSDSLYYCWDHPFNNGCLDYIQEIENTCQQTMEGCIQNYNRSLLEIPSEDATEYFRCEYARRKSTDEGLISDAISKGYRKLRWAPIFRDVDNVNDGIAEWAPCEFALETYGSNFREE